MSYDVYACLPKDTSGLPTDLGVEIPKVTNLYAPGTCRDCGCEIWIGARQSIAMQLQGRPYVVVCFRCATIRVNGAGGMDNVDVHDLGGGWTREGTVQS